MRKRNHRQAEEGVLRPPATRRGMGAMANSFMEWGRVHNFSDHTIDHAYRYLKAFIEWAEARGLTKPTEITKPILERYQRWLFHYRKANGDPLSFSTQKCYLVPLRSWFRWLAKKQPHPVQPGLGNSNCRSKRRRCRRAS